MKLHLIAAATLAASSLAHAGLDNTNTGNSSMVFIAYDTIGSDRSSAFIDLGIGIRDFAPEAASAFGTPGPLAGANTSIVWNFANNTILKNGTLLAATNDFSAFGKIVLAAQPTEFRWGVIGGDGTGEDLRMWTTGTPTQANLNGQDGGFTSEMNRVAFDMFEIMAPKLGNVDNGSYFAADSTDSGFIANTAIFGTNFQQNLKWQSTTNNAQTNFWMNAAEGSEFAVGVSDDPTADKTGLLNGKGTWTLDRTNQTLTWQTATVAAVPEASTYAMALGGLAVMGLVARRRRAQ